MVHNKKINFLPKTTIITILQLIYLLMNNYEFYIYIHIDLYIYIYIQIHTYIYTYTHMCVDTHTHMQEKEKRKKAIEGANHCPLSKYTSTRNKKSFRG